jgi:hypothetical protein
MRRKTEFEKMIRTHLCIAKLLVWTDNLEVLKF